ncbi:succinate-semialdehyde dehydrogenase (NADP(+)) [Verrucomicrobia bacterium LW23]|nr:succinate-semialdehyde dehydrogenase (NADP(+)) [Verrucomicrobia bacterium LW23]
MLKLNDPSLLRDACLINGVGRYASSGDKIQVTNPVDGALIGTVPSLSEEETEEAIAGAEAAFAGWARLAAKERSAILRQWFTLIVAAADDLAALMTAEQGKPLAEARGEITYAASFIEWFTEEGKRVYGEVIPAPQSDRRIVVLKQPVGVCAAITPWNFPAAMITRKAAPALAAGCTMIVKPAEQTPLTALALGELAVRAGVPRGVLQIITGDAPRLGKVLTDSPRVRKLSFTGSTAVGRKLMAQCAPTLKRLSLELGGNAPFIVFDDADVDAAVTGAIASKYRNAGQTCVCANRFYVQAGVYEEFARRLTAKVRELPVGAGTEKGVLIGPLIDEKAVAKVELHVADAVRLGATVALGGARHSRGGLFFQPTVITGLTSEMLITREETFGPVAALMRFETEQEVIALANATEFGLAAYFYTRDASRAWRVSEALEYGMVGHNTGVISNEVSPFGGVKQSGFGREGSHHGIAEYLSLKYVCTAVEGAS